MPEENGSSSTLVASLSARSSQHNLSKGASLRAPAWTLDPGCYSEVEASVDPSPLVQGFGG